MQFIAVAFVLLTPVIPWASRLARLFNAVLPLAIPSMISLVPYVKARALLNIGIVFCYLIYTIVTFFILGYHDILPYQTIFNR
jgi:hypothetical protein